MKDIFDKYKLKIEDFHKKKWLLSKKDKGLLNFLLMNCEFKKNKEISKEEKESMYIDLIELVEESEKIPLELCMFNFYVKNV